ncbi:DUF1289 domain-containing protein [Vibrio sp. RC27]
MFIGNNTSLITPCTSRCKIDNNNVCTGCYRTSQEITDWINKSDDEKINIVIRCKKMIAKEE